MDRKYIDDHHLVARYLANQLSDDEREAFENYFIEAPEVVQQLEASARFKVGMAQLQDSNALQHLLVQSDERRWQRLLLAAVVPTVAVGIGYLATQQPAFQPPLVESRTALKSWLGASLPIERSYVLQRSRDSKYDAEIEITAGTQLLQVRVLPEYEIQPPRYRVRLQSAQPDGSFQIVAEVKNVQPAEDGFVSVFLNPERVRGGRYRLAISDDKDPDAPATRSSFSILIRDRR